MNKTYISLRYGNGLVMPGNKFPCLESGPHAASFQAELMQYGYIMTDELYSVVSKEHPEVIAMLANKVLPVVAKLKGADVAYTPMYPNFPKQVMDMSHFELFINAITHYWTFGEWKPDYDKLPREFNFEFSEFIKIGRLSQDDFKGIFGQLAASSDSISEDSKQVIEWFMDNHKDLPVPDSIPFKENLCYIAGALLARDYDITGYVKTATDVLRIVTYLSDGDISLAENTKFKSLPRRQRRLFVNMLNEVARAEDINRHRAKWSKLFHNLHVNEYANDDLKAIVKKVRENVKIDTFNGLVQAAIDSGKIDWAVDLLKKRPGEFTRKVDHLLRIDSGKKRHVISNYLDVVDEVPTRTLLQLLGHLSTRGVAKDKRIVFPKGSTQRATVLRTEIPKLSTQSINRLTLGIENSLMNRFEALDGLGNVWIDPALMQCPLPTQQRSASNGTFSVARGTRLPFGDDKGTLRFFIYWVGQDIDLSATLHDENFRMIEHISYTNLKSDNYQSCHSGDIVNGARGVSEFIDITVDPAVKYGARYVAMNVLVYSGPTFAEHKKCYAGWMTREKPKSKEIYDPKHVVQKIDLTSESRNCIPVVFDLVERKAIWADLTTGSR